MYRGPLSLLSRIPSPETRRCTRFPSPGFRELFHAPAKFFARPSPLLPASPAPDPWRHRTPSRHGLLRRKVSVPASPRGARHTNMVRRRLCRRLRAERRSYPHSWCNVQARTADWQVGRKHWCLPRWKPFAVRLFRRKISKQSESWWRPEGTAERSTSRLLPPGPATHHSPFLKGDSPAATSREQLKTVDP